jgi:hypothetical protein
MPNGILVEFRCPSSHRGIKELQTPMFSLHRGIKELQTPMFSLFPTIEAALQLPHQPTLSWPILTLWRAPNRCAAAVGPKPDVREPLPWPLAAAKPPPEQSHHRPFSSFAEFWVRFPKLPSSFGHKSHPKSTHGMPLPPSPASSPWRAAAQAVQLVATAIHFWINARE